MSTIVRLSHTFIPSVLPSGLLAREDLDTSLALHVWRIDNKYYTADVDIIHAERVEESIEARIASTVDALVLVVDSSEVRPADLLSPVPSPPPPAPSS